MGQPHHGAVWYGMIPATRKVCWGHLRGQARPRLRAQPQTRGMEATSSSGAIPTSRCTASWEGGCKDTRSPWKPLGVLRARRCPRGLCAALHRLQEQGPHQRTGLGLKTSNPSTGAGRTRGSISRVSVGCILWKRPGGKGRQRASSRQRGALLFWHGQEQQKPAEGTEVGPWGVSLR